MTRKPDRGKRVARAMLFVLSLAQFAPASLAFTCDAVSAPTAEELPCHGEPDQPESPPPCDFSLNSGQCCCLASAPPGTSERGPLVPAAQLDVRVIALACARTIESQIDFVCSRASAPPWRTDVPGNSRLFISHHSLLI